MPRFGLPVFYCDDDAKSEPQYSSDTEVDTAEDGSSPLNVQFVCMCKECLLERSGCDVSYKVNDRRLLGYQNQNPIKLPKPKWDLAINAFRPTKRYSAAIDSYAARLNTNAPQSFHQNQRRTYKKHSSAISQSSKSLGDELSAPRIIGNLAFDQTTNIARFEASIELSKVHDDLSLKFDSSVSNGVASLSAVLVSQYKKSVGKFEIIVEKSSNELDEMKKILAQVQDEGRAISEKHTILQSTLEKLEDRLSELKIAEEERVEAQKTAKIEAERKMAEAKRKEEIAMAAAAAAAAAAVEAEILKRKKTEEEQRERARKAEAKAKADAEAAALAAERARPKVSIPWVVKFVNDYDTEVTSYINSYSGSAENVFEKQLNAIRKHFNKCLGKMTSDQSSGSGVAVNISNYLNSLKKFDIPYKFALNAIAKAICAKAEVICIPDDNDTKSPNGAGFRGQGFESYRFGSSHQGGYQFQGAARAHTVSSRFKPVLMLGKIVATVANAHPQLCGYVLARITKRNPFLIPGFNILVSAPKLFGTLGKDISEHLLRKYRRKCETADVCAERKTALCALLASIAISGTGFSGPAASYQRGGGGAAAADVFSGKTISAVAMDEFNKWLSLLVGVEGAASDFSVYNTLEILSKPLFVDAPLFIATFFEIAGMEYVRLYPQSKNTVIIPALRTLLPRCKKSLDADKVSLKMQLERFI